MSMNWENASQKQETHQKLEVVGKEMRPVMVHTFTFFLSQGQTPRPGRHPYYTASAATPEAAEQAAYMVYMRAARCSHYFVKAGTHQQKCAHCDVRLDTLQTALVQNATNPTSSGDMLTTSGAIPHKAPASRKRSFLFW